MDGNLIIQNLKNFVLSSILTIGSPRFDIHNQMEKPHEVTNQTILNGLKIRLTKAKGLWADELYSIL